MSIILTIVLATILLFLAASFSGLNVGLLMVRASEVKRKMEQGDEVAARIYRYRKDGNYLIVSVLLGNVMVVSALTLVLDNATSAFNAGLLGSVMAGLLTTLLVTAFGEILPQSIFSQRGWHLARYFFWLLDIVFVLFWPVAKPASILLDRLIGKELPALYSHDDFEHMIREHAERSESTIDHDESRIVTGALRFSKQTAGDIATPISEIFSIDIDEELNAALISRVKRSGHSRIPIKNQQGEFIGVLYVKDLLGYDWPRPVSHLYRDKVYTVPATSALDTTLSRLIQTQMHLFFVVDDSDEVTGVVTLEDIIEVIIRREIEDEHDQK